MLAEQDPRFAIDAYYFISEAVAYTVSRLSARRHVSAAELLDGIREFASAKFGVVASNVLARWGMIKEDRLMVL